MKLTYSVITKLMTAESVQKFSLKICNKYTLTNN